MIRGGILGALLFWGCLFSVGPVAQADYATAGKGRVMTNPGPIIWPWGMETRFPWEGVQGLWQIQSNVYGSAQYIFKVINSTRVERILEVTQYDPVACKVTAVGKGFESAKVVQAVMNSNEGPFRMTIHAFRTQDVIGVRRNVGAGAGGSLMVLRIFPFEGGHNPQQAFQLNMVQKTPLMRCN